MALTTDSSTAVDTALEAEVEDLLQPEPVPDERAVTESAPVVTWVRRTRPVLPALTVALSAAALACYLAVASARIGSPAALEWMEGGISQHVQRVVDGHSVYGPPSIGFTPYLYTPLFYYVGAGFRAVLGGGLWPLRLVSLLSSLALFGAVGRLAWVETRRRWAAFGAAGVLAATYAAGGSWLDVARVDTLCLALLFWGLALARTARRPRSAVAAGLLIAAAVMTKQVALLPALAVLASFWLRGRRMAAAYAIATGVAIGASTALLQLTSGGWFLFYAVEVPLHHDLVPSELLGFWTADMGAKLWPIVLGGFVIGVHLRRRRRAARGTDPDRWFLPLVLSSLVIAAYFARLHSGGFANVLIPAYAGAAVAAAVVVHRIDRFLRTPAVAARPRLAMAASAGTLTALFAGLAYNPVALVPQAASAQEARAVPAELAALPGPIYLPGHPEYLTADGRPSVAQTAAVVDVVRAGIGATGRDLTAQLEQLIRQRAYGTLVVDSNLGLTLLPRDVCRYYAPVGVLSGWWHLLPVTGTSTAPRTVWLARSAPLASTPHWCHPGSASTSGGSAAASG